VRRQGRASIQLPTVATKLFSTPLYKTWLGLHRQTFSDYHSRV